MSAKYAAASGFLALLLLTCHTPLADARAPAPVAVVSSAVVDASRLGELTLEFRSPNSNDDEPGPSNVGVAVQLQRVADIDLSTPEGWSAAAAMKITDVLDLPVHRFADHRTDTSGTDGTVVFSALPLGVWLARPPEGAEPRFEPFVLTFPGTAVEGDTWRYSFAVYPKVRGDEGGGAAPSTPPTTPTPGDQPPLGWTTPATAGPQPTAPTSGAPSTDDIIAAPGDTEQQRGILAETGVALRWLMIGGIALILIGGALLARRRTATARAPDRPARTPTDPTEIAKE